MSSEYNHIRRFFSDETSEFVRREIKAAGGNEILFFGWINENGAVERVEVVARGNDVSVAVPLDRSFLPDVVLHNHPNGELSPSGQDVRMSSLISNRGVGFYIIDNEVTKVYVVVEPVLKRKTIYLDVEKLKTIISSNGPFRKLFPNFEERDGQMRMVEHVSGAFNNDEHVLIEAGTGIGKSLAYLIPSVEWALSNNEKVVISTNTINLQEQLLYKDIPDLKRSTGWDFKYTLMKGRGNYICLNRLNEAKQDLFALIDDDEMEQFNAIEGWLETTDDVSLSNLPFMPKLSLWEKINSQPGACLGGRCAFFSECYVNRARRHAAEAHIIVTNHHYLLADAQSSSSGAALLPPYKRVIFDEAHNLESSATSFFTKNVTLAAVLRILNGLYTGVRKKKGYLVYLMNRGIRGFEKRVKQVMDLVQQTRAAAFELFEGVDEFIAALNATDEESNISMFEVNDELRNHAMWDACVLRRIDTFYKSCTQLVNGLLDIRAHLAKEGNERYVRQIEGLTGRLVETAEAIDKFLGENDETWVRWIQKKRDSGIVVALVEVGDILNDLVFSRMKSLVLTSATLTVDNRFDFIMSRLHIGASAQSVALESSFDYNRQMVVLIPQNGPGPNHPQYVKHLARSITSILRKTHGKAFVLFTSYKTLNSVYDLVKNSLSADEFVVFRQGDETRSRLMERFRGDIHSVLFGTESFWEGVDAPGQTLECVVITKLPFKVPTEPIIRARIEKIKQKGKNPFLEYYVPLAVIKMKQGIGRLIRNKFDRGIIVILDNRLLLKSYGSLFLRSIPTENIHRGALEEILEEADSFLSITP